MGAGGAFTAVDIPFFAGQDESIDKKVLPVGPLRKVENAKHERTGRWVERMALEKRPTQPAGGAKLDAAKFRNSLPGDRISAIADGVHKGFYWAETGEAQEFLRELRGTFAGFGYRGQYFASSVDFADKSVSTYSPSLAYSDDHIIFGYLSASTMAAETGSVAPSNRMNVIWYERTTLRVVRSDSFVVGENTTAEFAMEAKVACLPNGQLHVFVATRDMSNSTADGALYEYVYSSPSAVRQGPVETRVTRRYSTFDVDQGDGDDFYLAYVNTTSLILEIFQDGVSTNSYASGTAGIDSDQTTVYATVAGKSPNTAMAFCNYDSGATYTTVRISLSEGTLFGTSDTGPYSGPHFIAFLPGTNKVLMADTAGNTTVINEDSSNSSVEFDRVEGGHVIGPPLMASLGSGLGAENAGYLPIVGQGRAYVLPYTDFTGGPGVLIGGETAAARKLLSSPLSLVRPGNRAEGVPGSCGGNIVRVAAQMWERNAELISAYGGIANVPQTTNAHAIRVDDRWVVPIEQNYFDGSAEDYFTAGSSFVVLEDENTVGALQGEPLVHNAVFVAGSGPHVMDDQAIFFAGFTDSPHIEWLRTDASGVISGQYFYSVVAEYTDANGRIWRSPPSPLQEIGYTGVASATIIPVPPSGYPPGTRLVLYRTEANGIVLYQHSVYTSDQQSSLDNDPVDDATIVKGVPLYTSGGTLPNDPPPACRFLARTRDRIWAAALDYPARVQSSKFLRPAEGVHWSNRDNFFVDLPEPVTAVAVMDDVLLVFSEEAIFLVHGTGPTDLGAGAYNTPQQVPTDVGCSQPRSVITDASGVYFVSRRGIERINRGFSAPVFIGSKVRDVTDAYPFCRDAQIYQSDKTVRWLMSDTQDVSSAESVIVVYDTYNDAWSVYDPASGAGRAMGMGRALGAGPEGINPNHPLDGMTLHFEELVDSERESLLPGVIKPVVRWHTGELRPAGLLAGALGRRLNILGTFDSPVDLTIRMAFNDAREWHTSWVKTWTLALADYEPGDPVTLELTLPLLRFQSVRFALESQRLDESGRGFFAHGISVYFDTEGAGPRLAKAQKG